MNTVVRKSGNIDGHAWAICIVDTGMLAQGWLTTTGAAQKVVRIGDTWFSDGMRGGNAEDLARKLIERYVTTIS